MQCSGGSAHHSLYSVKKLLKSIHKQGKYEWFCNTHGPPQNHKIAEIYEYGDKHCRPTGVTSHLA